MYRVTPYIGPLIFICLLSWGGYSCYQCGFEHSARAFDDSTIKYVERETFDLINEFRENEYNVAATIWDNELHALSKQHTLKMAERGEIFHSMSRSFGENIWGGDGYKFYSPDELSRAMVDAWISSPGHNLWLHYSGFKHSVVSLVITPTGQYASWAFWLNEVGDDARSKYGVYWGELKPWQ